MAFTDELEAQGVRISMDGCGRWLDNVFVERVLRRLKCEEVHLKAGACPRAGRGPDPWPMVSRRASASANGYASTTTADRTERALCGPESRVYRSRAAHDIEPKLSKSAFHCRLKVRDCPSRLLNGSIWRRQ